MTRKAKKYLFDIARSIEDILNDHLDGIDSLDAYESNKTVRRAVAKELEIIGEAAYRLMQMGVQLSQSDSLINRRNTLIHQYDDYKDETIWYYVHGEMEALHKEVKVLLSQENE